MCLRVEKPFQCRRNHRIKHIEIREIVLHNRSWSHKFVNWFGNFNFCVPEHSYLRIGCSQTNRSHEVDFPALKFCRVMKFSKIPLRKRNSRIIHHTIVRTSSTRMIQHTTSTLEVRWRNWRIQRFSFSFHYLFSISQQNFLNSSISWQSLAWFSWKSLFLNSNSPYKLISSLWAWSVHRLAWCSWNLWDTNSWLISWEALSEFSRFPISCLNIILSFKQFCWAIRRHGTGNFCDCQGDWSACAPRSCSCRSWAHHLCFWSAWPSSHTFHSSEQRHKVFCLLPPHKVDDAEVLDTEHLGEDRTGRKRTNGTFNKDMANEMEMSAEKCTTQVPFTLSQCGVPTLEKCSAGWIVHCEVRARKMWVWGRTSKCGVHTPRYTHGYHYWLSASKKIFELQHDKTCGQTFWLMVTKLSLSFWVGWHQFPGCWFDLF